MPKRIVLHPQRLYILRMLPPDVRSRNSVMDNLHVSNSNDNNNYTFPVRGLGVRLDHLKVVYNFCPRFHVLAQWPPFDVGPKHPMQLCQ
jgi:hypothetical protein